MHQSTAAFRIPWGIQTVPACVLFIALFFCPYSPRWLASQDRWEEAFETLEKLRVGNENSLSTVLAQYREIEQSLRYEKGDMSCYYKILFTKRMMKRVILGASIQAWSQLVGRAHV